MTGVATTEFRNIYGLIAEFPSAASLVAAARATHAAGYKRVEAYAPFPVEELPEALDLPPSRIPYIMLAGAFAGCATGLGMQYYANFVTYPMNVGGRPLDSWPAFIPPTVELTILFAVVSGLVALFFSLHLPAVYHPVFNHPDFRRASRDGFFLCIECADERFAPGVTASFLETLAPLSVRAVEK
jgi:hypothetical protein